MPLLDLHIQYETSLRGLLTKNDVKLTKNPWRCNQHETPSPLGDLSNNALLNLVLEEPPPPIVPEPSLDARLHHTPVAMSGVKNLTMIFSTTANTVIETRRTVEFLFIYRH
jgi:hypothetical protein